MTSGMTRFSHFEDAFWEPDITSTRGFDILCKRMKDGKKVCKEVEEYFKERAKAESSYSRSLMQLVKKLDGKEETGGLANSWRELRLQTEKISQIHDVANSNFTILMKAVNKFNEDQTSRKDQLKSKYQQRCQEKDHADDVYKNCKSSVTVTTKEYQKAEKTRDKCNEQKEQAETLYKTAVEQLETARVQWEKEMENACQCCEQARVVLELCDVQQDILEFIERNKTGNIRPAAIPYEDYYRKKSSSSSNPEYGKTITSGARHLPRPPSASRPPPPRPTDQPIIDEDRLFTGEAAYDYVDNLLLNRQRNHHSREIDTDVGEYSTVRLEQKTAESGQYLRIIRKFEAQNAGEMTVSVGDEVQFVKEMRNGMIQVRTLDSRNLHGLIPSYCVNQNKNGNSTYL
ncbi:hypothetical protein KUTeg_009384 [Tegillarca granosa]|uniref:F-BAR domain-containing protein n=1 Tax=Tegillarca granosa TaxID=220873 RepID=A0ABQ9F715_TEGGR|nr:hypothetical protein KUTeg_009384 [Tegillarca granosa]